MHTRCMLVAATTYNVTRIQDTKPASLAADRQRGVYGVSLGSIKVWQTLYKTSLSSSSTDWSLSAWMAGPFGFGSGFIRRSKGLTVCSLHHRTH